MEIYQIQYFLELRKHQHMSVTADLLHISQPALSRSISALEQDLGIKLFDRVGKNIQLNKNGELFAHYAEKAMDMLNLGINASKNFHYEMTGAVSILNYAYAPILADCVSSYAMLNPYVDMMISQFSLGQNLKNNEKPDFILYMTKDVPYSETHGQFWVGSILTEEEYMLAATPELLNLPLDQNTVSLESLAQYPFTIMSQNNIFFSDPTFSLCQDAGFFAKTPYRTDSYEVKMDFVGKGLALGILPKICITKKQFQVPTLRSYHLEYASSKYYICLLRPKKALMSETALDFWNYTLDYFGKPKDERD